MLKKGTDLCERPERVVPVSSKIEEWVYRKIRISNLVFSQLIFEVSDC